MPRPHSSKAPQQAPVDIEIEVDLELVERRRRVRTIPCPEAVERDDEESWSDWVMLAAAPLAHPHEEKPVPEKRKPKGLGLGS